MRAVILLLLLFPLAHAQSDVLLEKELSKSTTPPGKPVTVTIHIKNFGGEPLNEVEVEDEVSLPGLSKSYSFPISRVAPGEKISLSYTVIPGEEGNFTLPPAAVSYYSRKEGERVTVRSGVPMLVVADPQRSESTGPSAPSDIGNESTVTRLYFESEEGGLGFGDIVKYSLLGLLLALPAGYLVYRFSKKRAREMTKKYERRKLTPDREDSLTKAKKLYYDRRKGKAFEIISRETKRFLAERYSLGECSTLKELRERVEEDPALSAGNRESLVGTLTAIERATYAGYIPEPEEFQQVIFSLSRVFRQEDSPPGGAP